MCDCREWAKEIVRRFQMARRGVAMNGDDIEELECIIYDALRDAQNEGSWRAWSYLRHDEINLRVWHLRDEFSVNEYGVIEPISTEGS
jgi:hypothetical protein